MFPAAVCNYSHFVVIDNILTENRLQPADWPLHALFPVRFSGVAVVSPILRCCGHKKVVELRPSKVRTLAAIKYNRSSNDAPKVMELVNAGRRMPQVQNKI